MIGLNFRKIYMLAIQRYNYPAVDRSFSKLAVSSITKSLFIVILAVFTTVTAQADGGMPLQDNVVYKVPENLASLSTEEISHLRKSHSADLKKITSDADKQRQAEERLFEQLMQHDLVRLSIADVIPALIKEYQIEGEFKDTLMGYQSTFSEDLMKSREAVENLADYPSYDFRFAAVYMSMLYSFQGYPDFYDRLKADMVNDKSHIGIYRKTLDSSYANVKRARAEMDFVNSGDDLKKVIAALDDELARREK